MFLSNCAGVRSFRRSEFTLPPSPSGQVCKLSARQLAEHYLTSTINKEINKPIALAFVSFYSVSESTKHNLIDKCASATVCSPRSAPGVGIVAAIAD